MRVNSHQIRGEVRDRVFLIFPRLASRPGQGLADPDVWVCFERVLRVRYYGHGGRVLSTYYALES